MSEVMYGGVYEKLPDIKAYLKRIGIDEIPKPTKENLDKLIHAHLTHIPYENLEPNYEKKCPDLSTTGLFEKIVTKGRGGYCFELNGLFYKLLEEVGYDVYPVACRMWVVPGAVLPLGHRASIVTIDGKKYFADVGTSGKTGLKALPFDGVSENGAYIKYAEPQLEIRKKTEDDDELLITFTDHYFDPVDFLPLNYFVACGPVSEEAMMYMVNLSTDEGAYSINGKIFKIHKNGETTEKEIENDEEFRNILKEYFGIVL